MGNLYRTCLVLAGAATIAAAPSADPLAEVLGSLHLHPQARIAAIANRGSCEAGELAGMLHAGQVIAVERDDLAGPRTREGCTGSASIPRVAWASRSAGETPLPVRDVDLIWLAGGFHQLYATLPPAKMTAFARALGSALAPGGSLIIADRLAAAGADPMTAAKTGTMDPQVVLDQIEATGLRLRSFANDASTDADGHTPKRATRFVMVFQAARGADRR